MTTPNDHSFPVADPAAAQQAAPIQYAPQQGQPIYIVQKPPATKKGLGIASMVLGISAIIFSWTTIFAVIMLTLAFIFGIISLKRGESPRGFAITGIVLGSAAVLLVVLIAVVIAAIAGAVATSGFY